MLQNLKTRQRSLANSSKDNLANNPNPFSLTKKPYNGQFLAPNPIFTDNYHTKLIRGKLKIVTYCIDSEIHVKVKRDLSNLRPDIRPPLYIDEGLLNHTEIMDINLREKLNRSTFLKSNTRFPNLIQSINNMV